MYVVLIISILRPVSLCGLYFDNFMNLLILMSIGWPPNGQEQLATQTWIMDHSITSVALFALSIF